MDVAPPFGSRIIVPSCSGEVVSCDLREESSCPAQALEGYKFFQRSGAIVLYCRERELGHTLGDEGITLGGALAVIMLSCGLYAWRRRRRT